MSYSEYLADYGKDHSAVTDEALAEVRTDLMRSDPTVGALGESLSSDGLSGSGYADYLRKTGTVSARAKMDAARHESELLQLENRSGYAKYLSQYDAVQAKLADEIVDKLSVSDVLDYDEMLNAAIKAGLTEDRAVIAAGTALRQASDNAVYRAIAFAKSNSLTPLRAKDYALSLGLPDELAERVYEAVWALSENLGRNYQSMSTEDFNNYIVKLSGAYDDMRTGEELEKKAIKERTNKYYEG